MPLVESKCNAAVNDGTEDTELCDFDVSPYGSLIIFLPIRTAESQFETGHQYSGLARLSARPVRLVRAPLHSFLGWAKNALDLFPGMAYSPATIRRDTCDTQMRGTRHVRNPTSRKWAVNVISRVKSRTRVQHLERERHVSADDGIICRHGS